MKPTRPLNAVTDWRVIPLTLLAMAGPVGCMALLALLRMR